MREKAPQYNHLPDGANDFGNGVVGPSLSDIQRANATLSFENQRAQETRTKDNGDLIFVSSESKLGRFFKGVFRRVPKRFILPAGAALSLAAAACSGGGGAEKNNNSQELENKESGYELPFPKGETWFLTNGPHSDGLSNGVKYAIDIVPFEGGDCPAGTRKSIDTDVIASSSGKVIEAGNDEDRRDRNHSIVEVKDKRGVTEVYMHLDNTKVKAGDSVIGGQTPLGNPSCEFPPGGRSTGPHLHVGLMKDGQAIPIDGAVVGGWTIHENGTMTKPGEKTRTASTGRYGENSTGIRNDLPNKPNKAVVAGPKSPISPISATVKSKEVFPATAIPIPTRIPPTETPKLAVEKKISISKKPEDLFVDLLKTPISKDILPSGMTSTGNYAGILDATLQAFKAIGLVNIGISENDPKFGVALSYTIFPNVSGAKNAYDTELNRLKNKRVLGDFSYPTTLSTINTFDSSYYKMWNITIFMVLENVMVSIDTNYAWAATSVNDIPKYDPAVHEAKAIELTKAAIEHLGKVGK